MTLICSLKVGSKVVLVGFLFAFLSILTRLTCLLLTCVEDLVLSEGLHSIELSKESL